MKALKDELKFLIVKECEKDIDLNDISDDEVLFGEKSFIGLDSLDALQISLALEKKYNIKLTDSKKTRSVMKNINTLSKYIHDKS